MAVVGRASRDYFAGNLADALSMRELNSLDRTLEMRKQGGDKRETLNILARYHLPCGLASPFPYSQHRLSYPISTSPTAWEWWCETWTVWERNGGHLGQPRLWLRKASREAVGRNAYCRYCSVYQDGVMVVAADSDWIVGDGGSGSGSRLWICCRSVYDEGVRMTRYRCPWSWNWRGAGRGPDCHCGWMLCATLRSHCGREYREQGGSSRRGSDGVDSCAVDGCKSGRD